MTNRFSSLAISLALLAGINFGSAAQLDSRGRTVETIIADGLAQLPTDTRAKYEKVIDEMAATGQKGIEQLAGMLKPAETSQNAPFEYAIDAIVSRVSMQDNANRKAIHDGLVKAIAACNDNANRAFLLTQLNKINELSDFDLYTSLLAHEYLRQTALAGLSHMPEADAKVTELVNSSSKPDCGLAKLAAFRKLGSTEAKLTEWAASGCKNAYKALGVCGSEKSLGFLGKAAKEEGFTGDKTDAYIQLASRTGDAKAAKTMMGAKMPEAVRCAGLQIYLKSKPDEATKTVLSALKDNSIQYRPTAPAAAPGVAGEGIFDAVSAKFKSLAPQAKTDVTIWLADNGIKSVTSILANNVDADYQPLAAASIAGLSKLGGDEALTTLIKLLGDGENAPAVLAALRSFNGDIKTGIVEALQSSDPAVVTKALALASGRRIYSAYPRVAALTASSNPDIANAATSALAGVAGPENFNDICDMIDKGNNNIGSLLLAACEAIGAMPKNEQYSMVAQRYAKAPNAARYYPMLALTATPEAIKILTDNFAKGDKDALNAILVVNSPEMTDILYNIAANNPSEKDRVLRRYAAIVGNSGKNPAELYMHYSRALALQPSADIQNLLLSALASSPTLPSATLAAKYLDNADTDFAAAGAVRQIIAKNTSLQHGDAVKDMLMKAREIFMRHKAAGDADAGYAVDDIDGILTKIANDSPTFVLSPEEAEQGFEVLFDGRSLDKWHGNTLAYVPVDGNINVSAEWGGEGNLYTKENYSDFIFRFEFFFDVPGVNNGVGIRTGRDVTGVDAAYEGMEIQILDHDDPIYQGHPYGYTGLRPYQNHGSVYGIVAPEHVDFGPIKQWHTEEIKAVGDSITVTVDGKVITKCDIRKACKGHNVAPDGSNNNPYTLDHKNHPGLFNKEGHISFCGHGSGLKLRNIRVLDLSKKKNKKNK